MLVPKLFSNATQTKLYLRMEVYSGVGLTCFLYFIPPCPWSGNLTSNLVDNERSTHDNKEVIIRTKGKLKKKTSIWVKLVQGVSGSLWKCWSLLLRLESNLLAQTGDIFFLFIGTFWYLVSKKFHNHSVIIHLVRNLRCETVKIWKIH